jgi:DNA-binding transcriptional LysR family regulator
LAVKPARDLVLTKEQHILLGELVEIMGQIDHMQADSAERFDPSVAKRIRGLTSGQTAAPWARLLKAQAKDQATVNLISSAENEINAVAEERNAFIHALYTNDWADGYAEPGYQTTSATRSKTGTTRSTSQLESIRDRAAKLSCLIGQIASTI